MRAGTLAFLMLCLCISATLLSFVYSEPILLLSAVCFALTAVLCLHISKGKP